MEGFAYFLSSFAEIKEGDGTLLDNMFVVADTETSLARLHSIENLPVLTAGRAGGMLKTGLHIDMKATSIARMAYTALNLMGVETKSFGDRSNTTSNAISEILA